MIGAAIMQAAQDAAQSPGDTAVFSEETFRFLGAPELWQIVLLIVPAVVLLCWWTYGGLTRLERRTRVVLATLRGLAIVTLLLALFQPAMELVRYTTVRTQVQVLVDDSASMSRRDTYPDESERAALVDAAGTSDLASTTRSQLVQRVLGGDHGVLSQLSERHDVRLFRFVREPRLIRDLSELTARGSRTQIGDALDLLRNQGSGNLDAVILVSDGRNNGGLPPVEVAQRFRGNDVPIYTLGVGDPNPPHNVRIVGPPGPQQALKGEEVVFESTLSAEGMAGRSVTVTLSGSRDGGPFLPLASANAVLGEDGVPVKVRLYHAFEDAGDWSLRFEVPPFPEETSHEDNRAARFLRVDDQKIRVLYIENLPRWEYRYVKNALKRVDPSIEFQAFLFDASRDFRQESSKTLPPLQDLPRTREEMQQYHVILLGDVPPEKLGATEEQRLDWMQQLVEFTELGGGVGFLYGEHAMPEAYRGTPIEDLLPVVLEDPTTLQSLSLDRRDSFQPELENPDHPHEIALLDRDIEANKIVWRDKLAPLFVYYPVEKAKAGAQVVLVHPDDKNRYGRRVLAAASVYPRGRTFFIATDETWRWRWRWGEKFQDTFWRNVVRYLASGRLRQRSDKVELRMDKVIVETGDQVHAYLEVRDDELQPSRAQDFAVFLRRPEGEPEKRLLHSVPGEPGTFQGAFTLDQPGPVSVIVYQDDNPQAAILAREDVLVKIPDRELSDSSQDRTTLEAIARASKGGRYLPLASAKDLLDDFRDRKPYQHEVDRRTEPVWDTIWVLLVALVFLAAEWTLRKWARLV